MNFAYIKPKTLAEAVSSLGDTKKDFFLAGGTDLVVKIKAGLVQPQTVVAIGHLTELRGIQEQGAAIRIGALCTHTELWNSTLLRQKAFVLAESAHSVGAPQIRNAGTIGGNICNASPAGDTIPALLVLNAMVSLYGKHGTQDMKLEDFLHLPALTKIQPGQILSEFRIQPLKANEGAAFVKVGKRKALAISVVNGAALLRVNGIIEEARIAIGSVAVKTIRLPQVEQFLVGKEPSEALFAQAGAMASKQIKPIDDIRGTAAYRKDVAATVVHRALQSACARAGKGA